METKKPVSEAMPSSETKSKDKPVPAVAECRRSSRKKIIKFDVRDLLNKNRKPHKIQIEARIDSNVSITSKTANAVGNTEPGESIQPKTATAAEGLSSKQKTFMEKSAIFRRFSVSQEQTKAPPPPPLPMPPTILKAVESKDSINPTVSTGKRLSRTQELYNTALLKPKQTASLIVAQVESNVRQCEQPPRTSSKASGNNTQSPKPPEISTADKPVQKKRGRPPKNRLSDCGTEQLAKKEANSKLTKKCTPEKATNWSEYKACLAQHSDEGIATGPAKESIVKSENVPTAASVPQKMTQSESVESTLKTNLDSKKKIKQSNKIKLNDKESPNDNKKNMLVTLEKQNKKSGCDSLKEVVIKIEKSIKIDEKHRYLGIAAKQIDDHMVAPGDETPENSVSSVTTSIAGSSQQAFNSSAATADVEVSKDTQGRIKRSRRLIQKCEQPKDNDSLSEANESGQKDLLKTQGTSIEVMENKTEPESTESSDSQKSFEMTKETSKPRKSLRGRKKAESSVNEFNESLNVCDAELTAKKSECVQFDSGTITTNTTSKLDSQEQGELCGIKDNTKALTIEKNLTKIENLIADDEVRAGSREEVKSDAVEIEASSDSHQILKAGNESVVNLSGDSTVFKSTSNKQCGQEDVLNSKLLPVAVPSSVLLEVVKTLDGPEQQDNTNIKVDKEPFCDQEEKTCSDSKAGTISITLTAEVSSSNKNKIVQDSSAQDIDISLQNKVTEPLKPSHAPEMRKKSLRRSKSKSEPLTESKQSTSTDEVPKRGQAGKVNADTKIVHVDKPSKEEKNITIPLIEQEICETKVDKRNPSNEESSEKQDSEINATSAKKKKTRKSRFRNLHEEDASLSEENTKDNFKNINKLEINDCEDEKRASAPKEDTISPESPKNKKILTQHEYSDGQECNALPLKEDAVKSPIDQSAPAKDLQTPLTTSTEKYAIENVSIETNTLLDILRTVQSNREAAEEARKVSEIASEGEDTVKLAPDLVNKCDSVHILQSDSQQRSNTASPLISKNQLPLNRSSSSSPLELSKRFTSPTRSNTSSPILCGKKQSKRLERRSRPAEDIEHKTLEETFAEIAALSSQSVLETKPNGDDKICGLDVDSKKVIEKPPVDDTLDQSSETTTGLSSTQTANHLTNLPVVHATLDVAAVGAAYAENKDCEVIVTQEAIKSNVFEADSNANNHVETDNKLNVCEAATPNAASQTKCESLNDQISELDVLSTQEEYTFNTSTATPLKQDELETLNTVEEKKLECVDMAEPKNTNKKLQHKRKTLDKSEDLTSVDKSAVPSKRGRKPKSLQSNDCVVLSPNNTESKIEIKEPVQESNLVVETITDLRPEDDASKLSADEKLARKYRQRKLKEAFEAALKDQLMQPSKEKQSTLSAIEHSNQESCENVEILEKSSEMSTDLLLEGKNEQTSLPANKPRTEAEDDQDPLKDIEKFIEDGVNLLKKDYKHENDAVDTEIAQSATKEEENEESMSKELYINTFETPADTPLGTPSVTPPPKDPHSPHVFEETSSGGVRRSHRIKLITKAPKALVGRGLVRDKERFSIKDDVETKSHYTLDDHLLDLAEVEAKNAKFLKEMEERLSNFHVIKENEYKCERVISREARKMICDCFLTPEESERGELACGEDCLNRLLMIECGPDCNVKERCTNKRFQKFLCSPCRVFRTEKKGFGIMADIEILPGEFIMEYVGEVIDTDEFEERRIAYSQDKNRHYYFMALRSDAIIDATIKGNISRFINHSCDPNAETQKWTVNGELRIGFFSRKSIMPGEEITFDYQYQRYGREAQRCYCESANCRGWIGQEPNSDEGEQIDDDESDDDEEEETHDTSLLEEDDDDSDASVSDPEEVQKKLEQAAAAELIPSALDDKDVDKYDKPKEKEDASNNRELEEDSKSKFKKLLSKMAEKVAAKQKQTKREQKRQRKKKAKDVGSDLVNKQRFLEDPDIEDEVEFLKRCGLKNQSDTLRLSRLMVRAKLQQTRLNLLEILRQGELPCRRLFLDYHGLRLVHGWMSEDAGNMEIRSALLQTLELLPVTNKTVLTDSKVMQVVRSWCCSKSGGSPNEDSSGSNSNSQYESTSPADGGEDSVLPEVLELQKLAQKLISNWECLPEIFRIPKKERIEQMKEHEREADRQYAETEASRETSESYNMDRFGKRFNLSKRFVKPNNSKPITTNVVSTTRFTNTPNIIIETGLSKTQRREMFAAKVARDEAEKRMAEERKEFETKCRFFGLDPKKTRPQDIPFCVNPATGQWYSVERNPIATPPCYAHVQVPAKQKSTDPADYQLPKICQTLPEQWQYAITPLGQIYYYHLQHRIPQWEPPTPAQLQEDSEMDEDTETENGNTEATGTESSDEDEDSLLAMDITQLKALIDKKVEKRRLKRYNRLVDERSISPRREEDRIYNQQEVRKYKENKEKIRKRKEEIRRRRAEMLRQSTLGNLQDNNVTKTKDADADTAAGALPIQDYLLSSDEDDDLKVEVNSPLIDKIVDGDNIVDELDALTTKRPLKRSLPPHRDLNELASTSFASSALSLAEKQEYKKRKLEKKEKRKSREQDAKYRRTKEKFRCEIAGIIVYHLKPYRKDTCTAGRIQTNEDFNHLARKLTHFVMIKELKYCESVGQTLVVTESVKNKSREFIKKYMTKYNDVYVRPANDPEFKEIPYTL